MKQEKSCGAVLFREEGSVRTYLILHSIKGHWSLCKGHVEENETEHETATREIREETGLCVDYVENFREVICYSPYSGCIKAVVFFLAQITGGMLTCQPEEVAGAEFLSYKEAMARLTHEGDRDVLRKAESALILRRNAGVTPLYDCLRRVADQNPLRLDMPGHHGRVFPVEGLADISIDFTENGHTGDLFGGTGDAIEQAERLWAEVCGFDSCLFLTGGSTQGNHTGLALLAGVGGKVALDRGSHRSIYNALALLDLTPRYISRPWLEEWGIPGPVDPTEVERLLESDPDIKTVCIVSPTYYGVLSDIPAIAALCHAHGAKLMVDGAHGAHLCFFQDNDYQAADVVVVSAHKTLPTLGQSALLFANGIPLKELQRMGSVYGSSSPSYLMMASLDLARDWMLREGLTRYEKAAGWSLYFRHSFPAVRFEQEKLDMTRLTLLTDDGFALEEELRERGIYPEMADSRHVVFIFTAADGDEEAKRLDKALRELMGTDGKPDVCGRYDVPEIRLHEEGAGEVCSYAPPEIPEQVMSAKQALFAPRRTVALVDSEGCISACQVAPYPPGVPVIAPGERIQKKHLAYLNRIGYNKKEIEIVEET